MVNHKHYIPILRWKAAEYAALKEVYQKDKKNVTPLIDFIMPQPTNTDIRNNKEKEVIDIARDKFMEKLPNEMEKIAECCGQKMVFIDTQLLDSKIRLQSLEEMITFGEKEGLFLSPVIYIVPAISSDSDMKIRERAILYAKNSNNGLCIRITKSHLEEETILQNLQQIITNSKINPTNIDIIIDLKFIETPTDPAVKRENINAISEMYPWRTFAVASGAFPKDLTEFEKHGDYTIERYDYQLWQKFCKRAEAETVLFRLHNTAP